MSILNKNDDILEVEKEINIIGNEAEVLDGHDPSEDIDGQLAVDVCQSADEFIVEAPIAGVNPDNLDISITAESIVIKGERKKEQELKDEDYLYQECFWGRFSRSIVFPQEIDVEKAHAVLKSGILIVRLPKLHRERAKKIKVKID